MGNGEKSKRKKRTISSPLSNRSFCQQWERKKTTVTVSHIPKNVLHTTATTHQTKEEETEIPKEKKNFWNVSLASRRLLVLESKTMWVFEGNVFATPPSPLTWEGRENCLEESRRGSAERVYIWFEYYCVLIFPSFFRTKKMHTWKGDFMREREKYIDGKSINQTTTFLLAKKHLLTYSRIRAWAINNGHFWTLIVGGGLSPKTGQLPGITQLMAIK